MRMVETELNQNAGYPAQHKGRISGKVDIISHHKLLTSLLQKE